MTKSQTPIVWGLLLAALGGYRILKDLPEKANNGGIVHDTDLQNDIVCILKVGFSKRGKSKNTIPRTEPF